MSSGRPRGWPRIQRADRNAKPPEHPPPPPGPPTPGELRCPVCSQFASDDALTCPLCGFPFTCDISATNNPERTASFALWRIILAITAVLFLLTSGVFYHSGYQEYHGLTKDVVARLDINTVSGEVVVTGPQAFIQRTQLTLALIKLRAPDVYWRVRDSVTSIEFLSASYLETETGGQAPLEHIGALAEPATGRIMVLATTAFPSGTGELWDRDVFVYAGVLVHELRHLELHNMDRAPGGWEEEALCEQAAFNALKLMQAPTGLLARYDAYLANPQANRYQRWYNWYDNWE